MPFHFHGEPPPPTARRLACVLHAGVSGSGLKVIGAAGHMSFVERRDEYPAAVCDFLSRVTPSP